MLFLQKQNLYLKPFFLALLIALFSSVHAQTPSQSQPQELPRLISASLPIYPPIALAARISGTVTIHVTTDGKKVISMDSKTGPVMLQVFTMTNIQSWEFAQHKPTSFTTAFVYILEEAEDCGYTNGSATLHLPLEARISAKAPMTCDPSAVIETKKHHKNNSTGN
jgi:hypothetical protein